MSNSRKKIDAPITENMKIRYYVMDVLRHAGKESRKLLSIRAMANKFSVSNSTVSLVLNKLEAEGFIRAQHGIGFFTVPESTAQWGGQSALIGIVFGYGKHFFFSPEDWLFLAHIGLGLGTGNYKVRILQLSGLSENAVFDEIQNAYLDGLVWVNSTEVTEALLIRLKRAGIATMTVNGNFAGIDNIDCSPPEAPSSLGAAVVRTINRLLARETPENS